MLLKGGFYEIYKNDDKYDEYRINNIIYELDEIMRQFYVKNKY